MLQVPAKHILNKSHLVGQSLNSIPDAQAHVYKIVLFPSGPLTKILHEFLTSPTRATYLQDPSHPP